MVASAGIIITLAIVLKTLRPAVEAIMSGLMYVGGSHINSLLIYDAASSSSTTAMAEAIGVTATGVLILLRHHVEHLSGGVWMIRLMAMLFIVAAIVIAHPLSLFQGAVAGIVMFLWLSYLGRGVVPDASVAVSQAEQF